MRKPILLTLFLLGVWLTTLAAAETCSSSTGCTECKDLAAGEDPQCIFVTRDASCTCDLIVFGGNLGCGEEGVCDYTGGTSGGGGGGGGGSGSCTRPAGSWCPPECSSCETVYWY